MGSMACHGGKLAAIRAAPESEYAIWEHTNNVTETDYLLIVKVASTFINH